MARHKIVVLYLTAGLLGAIAVRQVAAQAPPNSKPPPTGLVVKQADIVGQVFIAGEKPGRREEPARNVLVQVRMPENDEVAAETRTDDTGGYSLPALNVGAYQFFIGGMKIALLIEDPPLDAEELPKVIITILPKDLLQRKGR